MAAIYCYWLVCVQCAALHILSWLFVLKLYVSSTWCCLCRDNEPSCCFNASVLHIRNTKRQRMTELPSEDQRMLLSFFISGRSLCIYPPLCRALLIFPYPACLSSSVSSWRVDSVTAVQRHLQSCVGMSAGVRCRSWHHWLLRVWACVRASVNLMLVRRRCRWDHVFYMKYVLMHGLALPLRESEHCYLFFLFIIEVGWSNWWTYCFSTLAVL